MPSSADTAVFDVNSGANTITTNYSPSLTGLTMTASTATVKLGGSLTCTGALTLNGGTFDTQSNSMTLGTVSRASGTQTITLGSSAISITGASTTVWSLVSAGTTITANTAVVTCSGTAAIFAGGNINYNGLSLVMNGGGVMALNGSNTFTNVTVTGTGLDTLTHTTGCSITNLTINGLSPTSYLTWKSSVAGSTRTITVSGTFTGTNVHAQDITANGAAAPFYMNTLGCEDLGNNSRCIFGSFMINNYQFVKVGDGMSVGEKIR